MQLARAAQAVGRGDFTQHVPRWADDEIGDLAESFNVMSQALAQVRELLEGAETHHRTLWSVLEDGIDIEAIARATEKVMEPLDSPHTGILFTVPVLNVWGLRRPRHGE